MLHFLPEQNKKQISIEYILRVCIFLFLFIFCAAALLVSLLLPSVIFSAYKNSTVTSQLSSTQAVNTATGEDPLMIIKNANAMEQVLSSASSHTFVSDTIKKIVSLKNSDIQIFNISVSEGTDAETFVLTGTSKTRDGLTAFDNNLTADGTFSHIDLPVSDLIPDTDNNFTITLTDTYPKSQ